MTFSLLQQLREDVQSVFARDPAARNTLEVIINYPGIHAMPYIVLLMAYGNLNIKAQHALSLLLVVF